MFFLCTAGAALFASLRQGKKLEVTSDSSAATAAAKRKESARLKRKEEEERRINLFAACRGGEFNVVSKWRDRNRRDGILGEGRQVMCI